MANALPPGITRKPASRRKPNGGYYVRWRDDAGRDHGRTFERLTDARAFLDSTRTAVRVGEFVDERLGRVTVADYARRWAEGQPWRESTRQRMVHVVERHIVPALGAHRLNAVRQGDVQRWVRSLIDAGLAASTVTGYYRVLAAVYLDARRNRVVSTSPCDGVTLPRAERNATALVPLRPEQVLALAAAVPAHYTALVIVSAGLGLRQGEACGLTVDRVDFMHRQVRIDRQLLTLNEGPVRFGPPKTAASNRVLELPDVVAEELARHLARYGEGPHRLIFRSATDQPLRRSTWSDAFRAAARATGVTASTHDLRHYCASQLIAAGCSVKAVQSHLGHATAAETLDTYAHLWHDDGERIRRAVDESLRPVARDLRAMG